jgi:hypothetical protein
MLPFESILPQSLRDKLANLAAKLEQRKAIGNAFDGVLDELNALPPGIIVRADSDIAYFANLEKSRHRFPSAVGLFSPQITDMDQLGTVSGLEYLFIFHRDGYVREAALKRILAPLPSAFLFAAIAWRLNDWVLPVRKAAAECALRCFPATSPDDIAEAALTLLSRENSWGRWAEERSALAAAFARVDVANSLAMLISTRRTGPMATVLHYALRESSLDRHLEALAREAIQPAVRATAVKTLIDGYATWPDGWEWQWVNKPSGIRRRNTLYGKRPLQYSAERLALIEASARDPSVIVRRVAASSLIQYEFESEIVQKMAEVLSLDKAPSVRERGEFLMMRSVS